MQKSEHPYLADWFAVSLRWLVLLGITSSLFFAQTLHHNLGIVLLVSTLWNIFISILVIFNRRLGSHRLLNLLVDVTAASVFFFFSGGLSGPIAWSGLLALFSAGIYYGWLGGILVGILTSMLQIAVTIVSGSFPLNVETIGVLSGFNLLSGLLFGLLGYQLYNRISLDYKGKVKTEKDKDNLLVRSERERLQTLFGMIEALSETLNYEIVLETALDLSTATLEKTTKTIGQLVSAILLYEESNALQIGSSRHIPQTDLRRTFPAESGILEEVIKNANPVLLIDPKNDPELKMLVVLHNCKSLLCLPLHRGLNSYGVMIFAHPEEKFFDENRKELLEIISHQVVVAIQNARLFQDLEEDKQRIIESQEEARRVLARELHDGPTQSVTGIAMRVEILRKMIEHNTPEMDLDGELSQIENLARSTTKEIRNMLFNLRPLVLESEGLTNALDEMAKKMKDTYKQNVVIESPAEIEALLDPSKQTVIFQIAEEAVNNARKHARAEVIKVRLRQIPRFNDLILLEILDNGVGFNLDEISGSYERRGSLGMVNLRERAALVSGMLHIDTRPGKGTKVQVAVPLTQEAAERLQRGAQDI